MRLLLQNCNISRGNILHFSEGQEGVLQYVADNVKQFRALAGLSQAQLAEKSGLSRRMIVHIESGQSNVSLTSLYQVATALNVPFTQIVGAPQRDPQRIESLVWRGSNKSSFARLLGSVSASSHTSIWIWSLALDEQYIAEPDPTGCHEIIYVTEGCLIVGLEDEERILQTGDFTIYRSDQAYWYKGAAQTATCFIRNVVL